MRASRHEASLKAGGGGGSQYILGMQPRRPLLFPLLCLWILCTADGRANAEWQTLEGVRLVSSPSNDGDSFRAEHGGRTYIFRLYGADCPETDMSFPERVMEQAAEFGITEEAAVEWGHVAARMSKQMLSAPFRVVTRWEDAMGRSSLPRHYAYVLPAGGGDLGATLLAGGLARARGSSPATPAGFPRVGTGQEYRQLQDGARMGRRGAWGHETGRRADMSRRGTDGSRINVNTAEAWQLETLPGIGPVLAERIIARRPYSREVDLLRVPGIGQDRLRQISGRVSF